MQRARNGAADLETTREALASWRRGYGGRGRRIPEALWSKAAAVARVHGVGATARALRLREGKLAKLVSADAGVAVERSRAVAPGVFVELGGIEVAGERGGAVVELVGCAGDRVRVEVAAVDVVALARAFWSRGA